METKWNDIMELDFEQILEGQAYEEANSAVFQLARTVYAAGYRRAMLIQEQKKTESTESQCSPN